MGKMKGTFFVLFFAAVLLLSGCGENTKNVVPNAGEVIISAVDSEESGADISSPESKKADEIVLRMGEKAIEWKYASEDENAWRELVRLSELVVSARGFDGANGADGSDGKDGSDGRDGRNAELRLEGGYVQWRLAGGSWVNLVSAADIEGPAGETGAAGENGKTPEFRVSGTVIQWKYTDETIWKSMIDISDLSGAPGKDGAAWHSGSGAFRKDIMNPVAYVEGAKLGDYYLDTETSKVYICTFAGMVSGGNNSTWYLVGDFRGEKGDVGEKGDTGPQGEKGDTGPQGAKGDPGAGIGYYYVSGTISPAVSEMDKDDDYKYSYSPDMTKGNFGSDYITASGAKLNFASGHKYMVTFCYTAEYLSADDNSYDDAGTNVALTDANGKDYYIYDFLEDHLVDGSGSLTVICDEGPFEFKIKTYCCKTLQYDISVVVLN